MYNATPGSVWYSLSRVGHKLRSLKEAHLLKYERGRRDVIGEKNSNWKGGKNLIEDRNVREYRKKAGRKKLCVNCGAKTRLVVHHIDFDHFNSDPGNFEILCVSCHMSVHKTAYWDAKRRGLPTPKSNGPVGWKRGVANG